MRIDAHMHFWLYDAVRDAWITEELGAIRKNFLPNDIAQTLKDNNIDGIVAVQADQSHQETEFLVELSQVYKLIKGVVGWVDLRSDKLEEYLQHFSQYDVVKGFRHVIEGEEDGGFLSTDAFLRGIEGLTKFNYTYDLLIRPRHYQSTLACVKANPNQKFMLDHIAKPAIKTQEFEEWAIFMNDLAKYPNVYCKISAMVTEADWSNWEVAHFKKYIDHAVSCFGADRVAFGSDWPVCLVAASYEQVIDIAAKNLVTLSEEESKGFWGGNAARFYGLK